MVDILNYFKIRKTAVIIALIVLVFGSIVYITTGDADRNNKIMYNEIYGDNVTIGISANTSDNANSIVDVNDDVNRDNVNRDIIINAKTVLA
jgi:hypothetical protein